MQTCILSSCWRYDWLNRNYLEFNYQFFSKCVEYHINNTKCSIEPPVILMSQYIDSLEKCLIKTKQYDRPIIPKLGLYLYILPELMTKVISFLGRLKAQELLLSISSADMDVTISHWLLKVILRTEVLTELDLIKCRLPSNLSCEFKYPLRLRKLYLDQVHIKEAILDKVIPNCTAVESLCFRYCEGFESLRLLKLPKLKELKLIWNSGLKSVDINAPNLHSLNYITWGSLSFDSVSSSSAHVNMNIEQLCYLKELNLAFCGFNGPITTSMQSLQTLKIRCCIGLYELELHSCEKLACFELSDSYIDDEWLNRQLSQLPHLKILNIKQCQGLKHLKIKLKCLETLSLINCQKLDIVEIDCPNLSSFSCSPKGSIFNHSSESASTVIGVDICGSSETIPYRVLKTPLIFRYT